MARDAIAIPSFGGRGGLPGACPGGVFLQPGQGLIGGQGPADVIALSVVAVQVSQQAQAGVVFHAFGRDAQAKVVGQADDRTDDGMPFGFGGGRHDEGSVYFQAVDRQLLQIGQRRIARAEIVDGNLYADVVQAFQHVEAAVGIRNDGAFGDFKLQELGIQAAIGKNVADFFG